MTSIDVGPLTKFPRPDSLDRLEAAEEACFAIIIAFSLGAWPKSDNHEDNAWREYVADPLQEWAALAHRDGLLADEPEDDFVVSPLLGSLL